MVSAPPPSRAHHAVAWRAPSELHHLKTLFFPPNPSPDSSDARLQALSVVRAWTVRTRLPHSIESTAILVSTILADTPTASHLTLRLAYSSAICRFVNGLLDPAQQGQFALPMHQLARELGLDASFVEVRHAATHEELPSLCVLRRMAGRALDWLWSNYWCTIGSDEQGMDVLGKGQTKEEERMMTRAQMLVKRWRVLRKGNLGKELKAGDQSVEAKEVRAVIKDAVELGKGDGGRQALVLALLDVKALVPKGKRKNTMMDGALRLWSPLLRALDAGLDGFVNALLEAMVELWRERTGGGGLRNGEGGERDKVEANKEYNAALVFWAKHITSGEFTRGGTSAIDVQELAKECVMAPNEWSMQVLDFLSTAHPTIAKTYGRLSGMAGKQMQKPPAPVTSVVSSKRSLEEMDSEISHYEERLKRIHNLAVGTRMPGTEARQVRLAGKWKKWRGPWMDRPLGIVA